MIAQFFFLNLFLGADFHLYGVNILRHLAKYEDWPTSGVFPRVTICDFKVRQLGGNVHRYTVSNIIIQSFPQLKPIYPIFLSSDIICPNPVLTLMSHISFPPLPSTIYSMIYTPSSNSLFPGTVCATHQLF